MATDTKTLQIRTVTPDLSTATSPGRTLTRLGNSAQVSDRVVIQAGTSNLLLCHNSADRRWAMKLSERLGNRNLKIALNCLDSSSPLAVVEEGEKFLRGSQFMAFIVSKSMLRTDGPALERIVKGLSDLQSTNGRILTILKDNVSLPALLRLREWVDFRDDKMFDESVLELLNVLREDSNSRIDTSLALGANQAKERIVSNLFPIVETPNVVFSAETQCRTEAEVREVCGGPGPVPFLLRESRIYAFQPITHDSVFGPALSKYVTPSQEGFTRWLSDSQRAEWTISLLNNLFRHHAWKRGLRFDEDHNLFYFTRSKPKKVWWQIGWQALPREVTAPHMGCIELGNQVKAEVQYGWRHLGIRANFLQVLGILFLRLEPVWHLTQLDGKTSASAQPVAPLLSGTKQRERNGQILRSLRFWSVVLAKGHQELRINTGSNPMRARLTPLSGFSQSTIQSDRTDYDRLMLTEMHDDLSIPELGPIDSQI
jgi:hypothetical protein